MRAAVDRGYGRTSNASSNLRNAALVKCGLLRSSLQGFGPGPCGLLKPEKVNKDNICPIHRHSTPLVARRPPPPGVRLRSPGLLAPGKSPPRRISRALQRPPRTALRRGPRQSQRHSIVQAIRRTHARTWQEWLAGPLSPLFRILLLRVRVPWRKRELPVSSLQAESGRKLIVYGVICPAAGV